MKNILNILLYQPLENLTLFLYHILGNNFGLAIIALTILIKLVLTPLSLPALKSSQKLQGLKGELDEIKEKYKDDKARVQQEQLRLYKENGINPLGGCLPLLLQIPLLLILWKVLTSMLALETINSSFLWLNLSKPDPYYILPVLAGITQFIQSKMMMPAQKKKDANNLNSNQIALTTKTDKKEDLGDSLSKAMQTQNLYFMPILWVIMLLRLPSGLGLYLTISIVFGIVQQYFINKNKPQGNVLVAKKFKK